MAVGKGTVASGDIVEKIRMVTISLKLLQRTRIRNEMAFLQLINLDRFLETSVSASSSRIRRTSRRRSLDVPIESALS